MSLYLPDELRGLKIALAHDDFTQEIAGGENLFLAIKEIFPTAPIYTSMVTGEWAQRLRQKSEGRRQIVTSFMQRFPFKKRLERVYFPFYPLAFESLDLSGFDLVISSSSRFAHGIITRPETLHICYMNNPGRMFWEPNLYFGEDSKLRTLLSPALSYLRLWSYAAAQRVDQFIANSQNIAQKIERYFNQEARVVYPLVDLERFTLADGKQQAADDKYYLLVTRLVRWKKIDLAIKAAQIAGVKLKIVGEGPERRRLESLGGENPRIEFLGKVSSEELLSLYKNCQAFIVTQEEDFGIAALEAQACGRPVIAYRAGGALETVVEGKTGEFFEHQSAESLVETLKRFRPECYDPKKCRKNAERFSKRKFQEGFLKAVVAIINDKRDVL